MKFKPHKLILITSTLIIIFAAYVSAKQVEGFQATDMPNYNTLDELVNSRDTTRPSWRTSEMEEKEIRIKDNMNNSYPEHTALMNDAFAKSKALGDSYNVTIDKLYTATLNHVFKSSDANALKINMMFLLGYADSIMKGKPHGIPYIPNWFDDLRSKAEVLIQAMEEKFGFDMGKEPTPNQLELSKIINDEFDKILINIFNVSKPTDERDNETIAKILNAQIEYVNNYKMPATATTATAATTSPTTASTTSTNLAIYIGVGVGFVLLLGIFAYFMFSASQPSVAMSSTATIS